MLVSWERRLALLAPAVLPLAAQEDPLQTESVPETPPLLNTDPTTWEGWLNTFLLWASKEPFTFLYYVLLCLTPFFCISAYLSWKLSKDLEKREHRRKRKRVKKE